MCDDHCGHLSSTVIGRDDEQGVTIYGCDDCDTIWGEDDAY